MRVDATRVGRDADRIADEVIAHLADQIWEQKSPSSSRSRPGSPTGPTDQLVRTVTENSRTLKFRRPGFREGVENFEIRRLDYCAPRL
jgi:hypothetical protein